ncbi:MAG TPA: glutamine-hydrolyzing GMP synthase [Terriglobales bacterium]|nr:glutamine-hydrolyzing GMP synthase [Terriglobales bacterium]
METKSPLNQAIVVLDFGAQYSQLIARRIRELKIFSVVLPFNASLEEIRSYSPVGIILSGGPSSVYDQDAPHADKKVFGLGIPVLGICYGLQFMVYALGGKVRSAAKREYGHAKVEIQKSDSQLFQGLPNQLAVWMSHGDEAEELPAGFRLTAKTPNAVAAIENAERKMWAVQFHPEVHHTPLGSDILRNFAVNICGAKPSWTPQHFIDSTIAQVRQQVGSGRAICALSGGVDSSVAAVLVDRAMRDASGKSRLTCVFVNNGVLRKNEFEKVQQNMRDNLGLHLIAVDATDRFMKKLAGVTDPETKRKIIGNEFIEVFDDEAKRLLQNNKDKEAGEVEWLVQGTLYPDVIESRSVRGPSQVIKSHHNVGGLPEKMKLKLIEPLKDLFKDEVRRIGRDLGMPEDILQRQPFPGPGLAVRILGEVTKERADLLRDCDEIVVSEIKKAGLYQKIWQSFAVLLPVMSVGVMGDQRTYGYTCAVRAVHSEDGMTADWVPLPYEVLKEISNRIVNEVRGVNRVVYDITSKPPGTIEWE